MMDDAARGPLRLIITLIMILIPIGVFTFFVFKGLVHIKVSSYYKKEFGDPSKKIRDLKGDGTSIQGYNFWISFKSVEPMTPNDFENYKDTPCRTPARWFEQTLISYAQDSIPLLSFGLSQEIKDLANLDAAKCFYNKKNLGYYTSEAWFIQVGEQYYYRYWEY